MTDEHEAASGEEKTEHWDASDQSLLSATLMATPTQRIAWLEEVLELAYASGALKPTVPHQRSMGRDGIVSDLRPIAEK